MLRVHDKATGALLAELPEAGEPEVAAAVARARAAQPGWAALGPRERGRRLRQLARRLASDPELVRTIVAESGKAPYEAEAFELLYVLLLSRFYGGRRGRRALDDEVRWPYFLLQKRARVIHHPRGVVAVIGPWNWPLLNNYGDAVAPLMAGNAVVLKPSEVAPLTSLRVAEQALRAGLPAGVLEVVTGGAGAGRALVARADMVFFTGSPAAGREVARACADRLLPCVLELGGKSAMIVLADADLEAAARAAVWSAFANSGQVCIRTERVLVEQSVAEPFVARCLARMDELRPGDGAQDGWFDVGAMGVARQAEHCERQIAEAVAAGARLRRGGRRRPGGAGSGIWLEPALLDGVREEMAVAREETFGPVLPVLAVSGAEEAVALANRSSLGLSASVWSGDARRAAAVARALVAGSVCINDVLLNYFAIEAPLGGVKGSGMGFRHGIEALAQFCRVESVIEDRPLLAPLARRVARELGFPYRPRTLALLRRLMRWL